MTSWCEWGCHVVWVNEMTLALITTRGLICLEENGKVKTMPGILLTANILNCELFIFFIIDREFPFLVIRLGFTLCGFCMYTQAEPINILTILYSIAMVFEGIV